MKQEKAMLDLSRILLAASALVVVPACSVTQRQEARPEVVNHEVETQRPASPLLPLFSPCPAGFHAGLRDGSETCELDAAPAEPGSSACSPGWSLTNVDTTTTSPLARPVMACVPPLPPGRCPDGQRVDMKSGLCVAVGSPCPAAGGWPAVIPAGNVLYVRAGSAGTGTKASPLGSLGAALAKAKAGDAIVVGAGTYPAALALDRALTIVGTCPGQVIIEGGVSTKIANEDDPTTIEGTLDVVSGGNLTLRDVTVRGQRHGLHLRPGTSATVTGVRFDQNTDRAILVQGGTLSLRDAVVERTLPRVDGTKGRGLQVNLAGMAEASDVTFQDNDRGEVLAFFAGSSASLKDCLLQNTRSEGDGVGIVAGEGGRVSATTSAIQRKKGYGVYVNAGTVALDQAYVGHIEADQTGNGLGANIQAGGSLSAKDTLWHYMVGFGIVAKAEGSSLSLTRSTVAYAMPNLVENAFGRGVQVSEEANATFDTVHLGPSRETALKVSDSAAVTIQDLTMQGNEAMGAIVELGGTLDITRASSIVDSGVAFTSRKGGKLLLRDARIEDPVEVNGGGEAPQLGVAWMVLDSSATFQRVYARHSQGMGIMARNAMVDIEGMVIEDTLSSPDQRANGVGMYLQGSTASVHGLLVRRALMLGIYVGEEPMDPPGPPTILNGSDVVVQDIVGQEKDGDFGYGIMFHAGATAALERVSVSAARAGSVLAMEGGEADLTDLTVRDTRLRGTNGTVGYGMYVGTASHVNVNRGSVLGSHGAGVLVDGNGGSLEATHMTIQNTAAIGEQDGVGLRVVGGAAAKLRSSAILDSHAVGVLLQFAGVLDAEDLVVSNVAAGALTSEDIFGTQRIDSVGSCLLATARSRATLTKTRMEGCSVLGALFDDSEGTLTDLEIDGAPIGLAIQGFPEPEVTWSEIGLTTNDTPLNYRESDFPVPLSPPPGLSPASPTANLVRAEE